MEHELNCPMRIHEHQFPLQIDPIQLQNFIQQQQHFLRQQQQQQQQQQNEMQQQLQDVALWQLQQQQQQQPLNQLQQHQHSNNHASFHLSQCMPTPFAPYHDAKTLAAGPQNSRLNAENQLQNLHNSHNMDLVPIHSNDSGNNNFQEKCEVAIDRLPAFNVKLQSSTDYFPLAMPDDENWLTPLHCFVRRYCVEVFLATPDDVAAPCMGKRNPISVNQVGIRCPFCSPERMCNSEVDMARARENGVVYPSLTSRIYNATINLLQRHLRTCSFVPPEVIARYEELKSSNARSGASKKYWADAALRLGLIDTPDGIRLDKEAFRKASLSAKPKPKQGTEEKDPSVANAGIQSQGNQFSSSAPPLVLPSDKRYTTAFTFHLMAQMQPCVFTEADRLGRRRGLEVGFAGLACRHCFGVYGTGRFFPSSVKTMSDASKTLDVIYRHMIKCKKCPPDIKSGLRNLREFHDSERSKMPFGNQRAFFSKIWGRLHENAVHENPILSPAPASPLPTLKLPPQIEDQKKEGTIPSTVALKLQENSAESLQALYAHFMKNNSQKHTKVVNEAA